MTDEMPEFWKRQLDSARQQEELAWARVGDLEAEIERLRAKLQRLDVVRAAGYEAGVADERARWRWPECDER